MVADHDEEDKAAQREFICPPHEPNFAGVQPADEVGKDGIVDIPCHKCGRLGSARLTSEDVQWD